MMGIMKASDIPILDVTDNYIVVEKPHLLATVPLSYHDDKVTLLSLMSERFPEIQGESYEGYVLHRLDTGTRGLVLIARNEKWYRYMNEQQREGRFIKHYYALTTHKNPTNGYPAFPYRLIDHQIVDIISSFRPYGVGRKEVRPVSQGSSPFAKKKKGGTLYTSSVCIEDVYQGKTLYNVSLDKGFRHQVRSHLAWAASPLIGDDLYQGEEHPLLHLIAYKIGFYESPFGKRVEYTLVKEGENPFEQESYNIRSTSL